MENPFTVKSFPEEKHPRNAFDLGRRSVFTSDFFKIYPYFVQEVLPDDDFEIDPRVGIRAMPTQFPIQTKIRMSTEFYYVRNRTLDSGWEDRIFKNKPIEMPWLKLNNDRAKKMISTGSLGDALGVPTTIGSQGYVLTSDYALLGSPAPSAPDLFFYKGVNACPTMAQLLSTLVLGTNLSSYQFFNAATQDYLTITYNSGCFHRFVGLFSNILDPSSTFVFLTGTVAVGGSTLSSPFGYVLCSPDGIIRYFADTNVSDISSLNGYYFTDNSNFITNFNDIVSRYGACAVHLFNVYYVQDSTGYLLTYNDDFFPSFASSSNRYFNRAQGKFFLSSVQDSTDDAHIASNPFVGDNPDIRINALSFRAYEQICNYYYRSDRNNPYILDGEPQYNEFIPTHDPGPDTNEYDFHYRNWEMDRFVSALQTPQMGDAPLVGVIFTGQDTAKLTFSGSLDGGESQDFDVTVGIDEDDNISQILDFPEEMPSADLQKLLTKIQAGFSINQFRVTNSFQRFLENSLFRGRRYRNQMKSHFGVKVDYPDIDVPQYIGGASSVFDVGQVTNTADSPNAGLGDYVGTLAGGVSSRTIRMSCKEHGFIIGVVSFAPIPSYSQSIAKHLIKSDALDYFSPEFGKIGFVPIRYSELSPLQTGVGQDVHDVFGYQKAHYDYMQALDEVHGDFRTTLRQFVCTRTFASRPQLSASFIEGRPEQLNDIFVAENIADDKGSSAKFLCSSDVSCKVLRQIPIIGTPSLE